MVNQSFKMELLRLLTLTFEPISSTHPLGDLFTCSQNATCFQSESETILKAYSLDRVSKGFQTFQAMMEFLPEEVT